MKDMLTYVGDKNYEPEWIFYDEEKPPFEAMYFICYALRDEIDVDIDHYNDIEECFDIEDMEIEKPIILAWKVITEPNAPSVEELAKHGLLNVFEHKGE